MKVLLVTGGFGFLGRNVAKHFHSLGYQVHGIGHGNWTKAEATEYGFERFKNADVSLQELKSLGIQPDLMVHAAGSGSVASSFSAPHLDFERTVSSTAHVLEFMRVHAPKAKLVYPSSPAVHGAHDATPMREDDAQSPVSPYGVHKQMAESLCSLYRNNFNLKVSVIRFFSVYGSGLRKQLLWDACRKLTGTEGKAEFWGTGKDVRDWIHIHDAVKLVDAVVSSTTPIHEFNGATGTGTTVEQILIQLKQQLKSHQELIFKGEAKQGDPQYYVADLSRTRSLGWKPEVSLEQGLAEYAQWFLKESHR